MHQEIFTFTQKNGKLVKYTVWINEDQENFRIVLDDNKWYSYFGFENIGDAVFQVLEPTHKKMWPNNPEYQLLSLESLDQEVVILDNGGETFDRYSAIFINQQVMQDDYPGLVWYVGMSENPYHPQGFGQHGETKLNHDDPNEIAKEKAHWGKRIKISDLPEKARHLVISEILDMNQ